MTQPNEIDKLLEAVSQDPERLQELRRALLTRELLDLPEVVAGLAQSTAAMSEGVRAIAHELQQVQLTVNSHGGHISRLVGMDYQGHVARYGLGPIRTTLGLDSIRLVCNNDRDDGAALHSLVEARGKNPVSQEDMEQLLHTDLVFTGVANGEEVFVLAEASLTARQEDFARATSRSRILSQATGIPTFAIAAGSGLDSAAGLDVNTSERPRPGKCVFVRVAYPDR